jgi:hypothetical protein
MHVHATELNVVGDAMRTDESPDWWLTWLLVGVAGALFWLVMIEAAERYL